jgi:hypothetical protein
VLGQKRGALTLNNFPPAASDSFEFELLEDIGTLPATPSVEPEQGQDANMVFVSQHARCSST